MNSLELTVQIQVIVRRATPQLFLVWTGWLVVLETNDKPKETRPHKYKSNQTYLWTYQKKK